MHIEEMGIDGAWLAHSTIHRDSRGSFREWFKADEIKQLKIQQLKELKAQMQIKQQEQIENLKRVQELKAKLDDLKKQNKLQYEHDLNNCDRP
jgi:dTDP-4-dehydrorhamnose 3,5-epimerase-like enzyme